MTAALSLTLVLSLLAQSKDAAPSSAARFLAMRELAGALTLVPALGTARAERIAEPIYRFDDPARSFSDGTLWAFGKSGRPAALLCLSLEKADRGGLKWIHELTSLSTGPIAASSRHGSGPWIWNPKEAGVALAPIPGSPAPADDEAKRFRQLRDLARRFKASESLDPARNDPSDRYELRLLPQPVHRYADSASGLIDGAVFLLAYGRNPEIALLIEARREGAGESSWRYGLARIGAARLRVRLDDREVADLPKPLDAGWKSPYFLFDRPALGLKTD
jgi:hypothetical protein